MLKNGSVQSALRGEYNFTVKEVFQEAWMLVKGAKLIVNLSLVIYVLIAFIVQKIISLFINPQMYYDAHQYVYAIAADETQSLLSLPIIAPIIAGIVMIGVQRASLKKITIPSIFNYYIIVWPLVFASILVGLSVVVGFAALIIPGIYLSVAFSFTTPLIVDKGLGVVEAMKTSLLAVHHQWFRFFGIYLLFILLFFASFLTLGIALIWLLPFMFIVNGILYRILFGYSNPQNIPDDE